MTQWETRGEKRQKAWEPFFFLNWLRVGVEEWYRETCIGTSPDLLSLLWDQMVSTSPPWAYFQIYTSQWK